MSVENDTTPVQSNGVSDSILDPSLRQSEADGYPLGLSSLIYAVRAFERSKIYTEDAEVFREFAKAQIEIQQYEHAVCEIIEASFPAQEQWQDRSQPPPKDDHDYAHECLIEAGREKASSGSGVSTGPQDV